jgi:hypothetical protein
MARPFAKVPTPVLGLVVAALATAASMAILSHTHPAGNCATQKGTSFVDTPTGANDKFSGSQIKALECLGAPALVPAQPIAGFGNASPKVAVTAHHMMYNVTWKAPDGRTASLMIDHSLGSKLDQATINKPIDLGNGITGYLTYYSGYNGQTPELAWNDPRTHMWYKINGLPTDEAVAFYKTLRVVDLNHAQ